MNTYSKLELFCREVEVQVGVLTESLTVLKTQPLLIAELNRSSQASHAVWGAARLMKLDAIVELANLIHQSLLAAQNKAITLSPEQVENLLYASRFLLDMSKAAMGDFDQWLNEHSWSLGIVQTALRATAALNHSSSSNHSSTKRSAETAVDQVTANSLRIEASTNSLPTKTTVEQIEPEASIALIEAPKLPETSLSADASMLDLFRLEAEAQVVILNDGILALEDNVQSGQALETLMRAAHSLKGAARIVSLDAIVNLAHVMEDCFVAAQQNRITLSPDDVDVLLQAVDLIQGISQVSNSELSQWLKRSHSAFESIRSTIAAILDPTVHAIQPKQTTQIEPEHREREPNTEETGSNTLNHLPEANRSKQSATIEQSEQAIQDRVVRVSAENLNRIMGLAGESLIEANWLQPYADSMMLLKRRLGELSRSLEQLQTSLDRGIYDQENRERLHEARQREQECFGFLSDRLTELELYAQRTANLSDRLYREVISSNMRPFNDGVQGFPRMIRDLARKLNKKVKLEIIGKSTPVDRDILKKLEAPLTHILRNATDHGIESPEERIAAGKSAEGTIRLEALHRGGMLAITIADDGKGINLEQLCQKVVNKNLTTSEMAAQLSDSELLEFLFLPGFSTAKQVTEISGRGVGLDIAKSMAQEVGGTVRAMSQVGKGTSFHFQLPLTLSVVRTLLVEISGKPYAIPLARIDQIVRVERSQISDVENREYFTLNQQHIGLVAAHQILELPEPMSQDEALSVIVVSDQSRPYGLVVDKFLGERDLVVRPLDPRLGKVRDISATSLLADGTPILIVDVADMVRSIDMLLNSGQLARVNSLESDISLERHKRILVVDDSITVREMERKLLENRGYTVDVAVNGAEGWNAIRTNQYDLVISDIDMPQMNGIELVKHIKNHSRLHSLPVIIVSYRDRPEDRIQGLEAGADYYLTKSSFHDDGLIDAVVSLVGR
ncbi:hybrid sensor histidine kinase/response regulator [Cyanobacteria bacterium FACHB-63]|nr:hybrid sensor histidine kinase/response regulator [Cyanobacteria bacterium FACHB-63]